MGKRKGKFRSIGIQYSKQGNEIQENEGKWKRKMRTLVGMG